MKTVYIILGVITVVFVVAQIIIHRSSTNIEAYPYTVEKTVDDLEIRAYEASLFTSVPLSSSSYNKTSSEGFSKLGGYIFGANETNEKIAMTSPVAMTLGDSSTMKFMVPRNLKMEDLPTPSQSDISFEEIPSKKMAVISFGGWANDQKIEDYKKKLTAVLEKNNIPFSQNFYVFGYNPPYDLFFRSNEVAVELVDF
jgi:hypothetical protein